MDRLLQRAGARGPTRPRDRRAHLVVVGPPVLAEGAASRLTVTLSHDGHVANLLGESVEEVAGALAADNGFHNAWDYATDLLRRLPSHPINRLEELLPDNWKINNPA